MKNAGTRQSSQKDMSRRAIGNVAAGEQEGDGTAIAVGQCVDFGRTPTARAADGLRLLPPLPPAAERCALTAELDASINAARKPIELSVSPFDPL